jgi:hypothetical protein
MGVVESHDVNEQSLFDQRLREGERGREREGNRDGSKQITAALRTLFIHLLRLYTDAFTENEGVK